MNFNEYQEATRRTAGEFSSESEELIAWSMGVGGEAGEVVDSIKKVAFHGHRLDVDALAKEIGDAMYYLARLSDCIGFDFEEVAKMNIRKLQRRYPEGFSHEASRNRAE